MEHRAWTFALAVLAMAALVLNLGRRKAEPAKETSPDREFEEMLGI